uniref:Uncharacterized protein n=1 Tax=Acrobeloides nanus TaxID=290746 RepID=A0A914D344_9BILA
MVCDCIPSIGQVIFTLVTFYSLKFAYSYYKACCCSKQAPKLQKQDWKKDVVYLYQFPRTPYSPNLSPFCLKLEAFLRLHEIKYEPIFTFSGRSKKGLLPFIELNGEHIADSQLIILHLKKYFNIQDELTNEQKAIERAFDRLIESTFFNAVNWLKVRDNLPEFVGTILSLRFGKSLDFLKYVVAPFLMINLKNRFETEGTAKHSDEEIMTILRNDLQAVETYLGDKEYFFGDQPSQIDIEVFAHVAAIYYVPYHHVSKDLIETEFPQILKHTQKVAKRFFSEFQFGL